MNCMLCDKPIQIREDYLYVKRHIPNGVTYTPQDAADRGIHIGCVAAATAKFD